MTHTGRADAPRTFAIGDIHGDRDQLRVLLETLPALRADDTLVFLGDYVDRGPNSAEVIAAVRGMQGAAACAVVALRGNHEDAWLRVLDGGWPEFVIPPGNGCLATMRSFTGRPQPEPGEVAGDDEFADLLGGTFFPADVVTWMRSLPWWHEDEHAIYVHAGVSAKEGKWLHPADVQPPSTLLWTRSEHMFTNYRGKTLVIGHTNTGLLPPELSTHTPADPKDLWAGENIIAIDTGCGKGGFLTAVELPARIVYGSRATKSVPIGA